RFDPTVGASSFNIPGRLAQSLAGQYYTSSWGRGCANAAGGFGDGTTCDYNGPRWFDGPSPAKNETKADPISGNQHNAVAANGTGIPAAMVNFNNAGALTGVAVIHRPAAYQTVENTW